MNTPILKLPPKLPLNIGSADFIRNKHAYFRWMREERPVCEIKVTVIKAFAVSRYDDCISILKDPRLVRSYNTAGKKLPFFLPKVFETLSESMIRKDAQDHRRLRNLVQKAFTPRALKRLDARVEALTHELLDGLAGRRSFDLKQAYALPVPTTVVSEMMGVGADEMTAFARGVNKLVTGFSGIKILKTLYWDVPKLEHLMRDLIARKRKLPDDDILTGLIAAEEEGDRLSEEELLSMAFTLITAGFETTVHLITNGVVELLRHPDQLARLRADPSLYDSAIEEILRFCGPAEQTKPGFATEEIELHGVTIPKGSPVVPLIGAANRDPAMFENPEVFDIGRTPNRHLAFGHGVHFCLGAHLARMETKIALRALLERYDDLRFVDGQAPEPSLRSPFHSYESLPVQVG